MAFADLTGRHTLTAVGGVTQVTSGRWGPAAQLDGSSGYIDVTDNLGDFAIASSGTLELVFRTSVLGPIIDFVNQLVLFGAYKSDGTRLLEIALQRSGTTGRGIIVTAWYGVSSSFTFDYADAANHVIAFSVQAGAGLVHIDGVLAYSHQYTASTATTPAYVRIGASRLSATATGFFPGVISDVRWTPGVQRYTSGASYTPTQPTYDAADPYYSSVRLASTLGAINAAPVLTPAAPALPIVSSADTDPAGTTVAALLGTSASDANGTPPGIAITGWTGAAGAWQYRPSGASTWTSIGSVSESAALLLASTTAIRLLPSGTATGVASLTYRAWDGSSGSAGGMASVASSGGSTAFSAASDTATVIVAEPVAVQTLSSAYVAALHALLPRGPAWLDADPLLAGAAAECTRVHDSADALVLDMCPVTTTALIGEFEGQAGITPDAGATLAQRRAAVVAQYAARGGQSVGYFVGLAASAGYTVTVEECRPFELGRSAMGAPLGETEWHYTWIVRTAAWLPSSLRRLLLRCAPAHTYLHYDMGS